MPTVPRVPPWSVKERKTVALSLGAREHMAALGEKLRAWGYIVSDDDVADMAICLVTIDQVFEEFLSRRDTEQAWNERATSS